MKQLDENYVYFLEKQLTTVRRVALLLLYIYEYFTNLLHHGALRLERTTFLWVTTRVAVVDTFEVLVAAVSSRYPAALICLAPNTNRSEH